MCNDFASIDLAIAQYFSDMPEYSCKVVLQLHVQLGDQVEMTNHNWAFSQNALRSQLKLDALFVINDFTAVSTLPVLGEDQVVQIGEGTAKENGNIAVFGPGTGLGVAITMTSTGWQTLDGRYCDFAPVDETDVVVWRHLQSTLGRASLKK